MPYYKDLNDKLHFLDSIEHSYLLPEGCIQLTDEEAIPLISVLPAPTYKELRAAEYPDFRDYLDGVVKGDQTQIDAYIATCLAIKAKYPKE